MWNCIQAKTWFQCRFLYTSKWPVRYGLVKSENRTDVECWRRQPPRQNVCHDESRLQEKETIWLSTTLQYLSSNQMSYRHTICMTASGMDCSRYEEVVEEHDLLRHRIFPKLCFWNNFIRISVVSGTGRETKRERLRSNLFSKSTVHYRA